MITSEGIWRVMLRFGVLLSNTALFGVAARHLGSVQMGIWSLASAMTSIVMSLDFGVANFTRNQIVHCKDRGQEVFSAGLLLTAGLAAMYGVISIVTYAVWPVGVTEPQGLRVAVPYIILPILVLSIRLPTLVGMGCFFSFNEANLNNVFEFAAMFCAAAVALLLLVFGHGIRDVLLVFYATGTAVAWLGTWVFLRRRRWSVARISWPELSTTLKGAWRFGLLQIIALGLSNMPAFVIGSLVGIENVTAVRATIVIGQAVLSLHLAHAMPLWTAFSRMRGSSDAAAQAHILRVRLGHEVVLLAVLFAVMAMVSPFVIDKWVGHPIASLGLCVGFAFWAWGCGICNLYSLVLNGFGLPLLTATALVPGTLVAMFLAKLLAARMGSDGVGVAFAIGAMLSAILMIGFALKEIHRLLAGSIELIPDSGT